MIEPLNVVSSRKNDQEICAEFKQRIEEAVKPLFAIADEIRAAGFVLHFGFSPDWKGKSSIERLTLSKVY